MLKRRKQNRLAIIALSGVVLAIAVGLTLAAFNEQIVFFKSPTDIAEQGLDPGVRVRVGGLVKEGSWKKQGAFSTFIVTDTANEIEVVHKGILPDLFREGQGVVLDGERDIEGKFIAAQVLAKHDENYVPKEVADALKAQGVWKEGDS